MNTILSLLIFAMVVTPGVKINPLFIGLSPLLNNDLGKICSEIAKKDAAAKWAVFGEAGAQYLLKVWGIYVINGVKSIPDLDSMKIIDPNLENRHIYNRYAHIVIFPGVNPEASFELPANREDRYNIYIDPASHELSKLGVKYVVFSGTPPYANREVLKKAGLKLLTEKPINRCWICRLPDNDKI